MHKEDFSRHPSLLLQSLNTHTRTHPAPLPNDDCFLRTKQLISMRVDWATLPFPCPLPRSLLPARARVQHPDLPPAFGSPGFHPHVRLGASGWETQSDGTISARLRGWWSWARSWRCQAPAGLGETAGLREKTQEVPSPRGNTEVQPLALATQHRHHKVLTAAAVGESHLLAQGHVAGDTPRASPGTGRRTSPSAGEAASKLTGIIWQRKAWGQEAIPCGAMQGFPVSHAGWRGSQPAGQSGQRCLWWAVNTNHLLNLPETTVTAERGGGDGGETGLAFS